MSERKVVRQWSQFQTYVRNNLSIRAKRKLIRINSAVLAILIERIEDLNSTGQTRS